MKELKWKHDKSKCSCSNKKETKQVNGLEVLTPYPKKRNKAEKFFNRYNHIMEFTRTVLALITVTLQLIILYRLFI